MGENLMNGVKKHSTNDFQKHIASNMQLVKHLNCCECSYHGYNEINN